MNGELGDSPLETERRRRQRVGGDRGGGDREEEEETVLQGNPSLPPLRPSPLSTFRAFSRHLYPEQLPTHTFTQRGVSHAGDILQVGSS